jgi:hypothetical protein
METPWARGVSADAAKDKRLRGAAETAASRYTVPSLVRNKEATMMPETRSLAEMAQMTKGVTKKRVSLSMDFPATDMRNN